ncbi:MAG: Glu-tRNA(Gln) amidotransferase subunit GatE [Candidatus Kariarchaeaceae archaeon]
MLDPNNLDWKALGFTAGLEVHHQLQTDRKLFCNCTTNLLPSVNAKPDYTFVRYFRAVLGEMGDYDAGMLVEYEKKYQVIYHSYDHLCTYEMDESPPFWPNMEAIEHGFDLAFLFNCSALVDELQVNRKQYLDGSITTGFQRTMTIARDGYVSLSTGKKVRIPNILVEEDAARKVKTENDGRTVYYNLDRLGVPLAEIITNNEDIENPQELQEAAYLIGLALRSTGIGKRGIGTVRQDVNISIRGGDRVELKGVQYLRKFEKICAREVVRQHALIEITQELNNRSTPDEKRTPFIFVDLTHLFEELSEVKGGKRVLGIKLPNFNGLLGKEVQPGKDLGIDMIEKAELITGLDKKLMIHSDELLEQAIRKRGSDVPAFISSLNATIDAEIRTILDMSDKDAYVLALGPQERAIHALNKIQGRAFAAYDGVPQETRRVTEDLNSEFLRVIHGKDRIYPDTDTPPIMVDPELIKKLAAKKRITPWDMVECLGEEGFSLEDIGLIIRDEKVSTFHKLVVAGFVPRKIFSLIIEIVRNLTKKNIMAENLTVDDFKEVLALEKEGKIGYSFISKLLEYYLAGSHEDFASYWLENEEKVIIEAEWGPIIEEIVRSIPEEIIEKTINQKVGWVIYQLNTQTSFKVYNNKDVADKIKGLLQN